MRYLVIGAAGHAQEVAWSLRAQAEAEGHPAELLFFDDAVPHGPLASGLGEVVGDLRSVATHAHDADTMLVLGVGLPHTKAALVSRLAPLGLKWATVVHPRALLGPGVVIGFGSYVGPGAIVTVNVSVGRFATINCHCLVAHESVLGDFVTLHPDTHLSGNVAISDGAELGAGAIVIPGVTIGPWAVLGAGCTAVVPLAGHRTYVGVPARALPARRPTVARSA